MHHKVSKEHTQESIILLVVCFFHCIQKQAAPASHSRLIIKTRNYISWFFSSIHPTSIHSSKNDLEQQVISILVGWLTSLYFSPICFSIQRGETFLSLWFFLLVVNGCELEKEIKRIDRVETDLLWEQDIWKFSQCSQMIEITFSQSPETIFTVSIFRMCFAFLETG